MLVINKGGGGVVEREEEEDVGEFTSSSTPKRFQSTRSSSVRIDKVRSKSKCVRVVYQEEVQIRATEEGKSRVDNISIKQEVEEEAEEEEEEEEEEIG